MALKEKKDIIIKIILVIIIIILLIHNCTIIKKKGKERTPSGNVNIIEIICKDDNKCDEKKNDKTTDNGKVDNSNQSNSQNNNKNNSDNKGTNSQEETTKTETDSSNKESEAPVEEDDDELTVHDSRLTWSDESELKIFTNSVYNFEDKIAPESSNVYQFVVKNSTKYNLKYNISFLETNPHNINMKYKLKKNNTYIVDHYVTYSELNISNQLIDAKTNDTYYLEWKWFSSDNDNEAGENRASYSLKIGVEAESVND